jgi:hypothetical protein
MDQLDQFRTTIRSILTEHARIPPSYGELRYVPVFDRESDRYVLLLTGRDFQGHRVNVSIIHVDILDGKLWVQADGAEYGVAQELADAGVPKDQIVLGFWPPETRKRNTEFAVA